MNNYVRKLFGVLFQSQPAPQIVRIQPSRLPTSPEEWRQYWQSQGQPWRTEPEIDAKWQEELIRHRAVSPDIDKGIYPFKGMKLSRADVEWLLATHENGCGSVIWRDESQSELKGLDLRGADLSGEDLSHLPLAYMQGGLTLRQWELATEEQRNIAAVRMEKANLGEVQLQGANLGGAQLQGANLNEAQLQRAFLRGVQLQRAYLRKARLQGTFLGDAQLQGSHLRGSDLDGATLDALKLSDEIYGSVRLADVRWGDVNLTVVDWEAVRRLGDEQWAHQKKDNQGNIKTKRKRLGEYKAAVRAYRQLSVALQSQGLNEDAARFAYRAQCLQRVVLRRQQRIGQYLFSWFLFLIAGYGYRPERSFLTYLFIIVFFSVLYHLLGPQLLWNEAFVISMTAFHGRGFFPGTFSPGDPLALASALEAFIGLIIEVTFIATITQRFFGK